MEDARSYLIGTAPAAEGLFRLLNEYGWQKMQSVIDLIKSRRCQDLEKSKEAFASTDVAREIVAGSILQIAYVAIQRYAVATNRTENPNHFKEEIYRLIKENPNNRLNNRDPFDQTDKFWVGRKIGDLPLGIIVYAGRNQYNHYHANSRLNVLNELVFNHLHTMWPTPKNGISFDLYKNKRPRAYSILAALGWIDCAKSSGYIAYKQDMFDVLQIEL